MAAFPSIYRRGNELHNPIVGSFEDTIAHDPTIRSLSAGGYVTSRAGFTRISGKWTLKYDWVSQANKNLIKAHETTQRGGSDSFAWKNPEDNTSYTVRYLGLAKYTPHPDTNFLFWMMEFVLEEV